MRALRLLIFAPLLLGTAVSAQSDDVTESAFATSSLPFHQMFSLVYTDEVRADEVRGSCWTNVDQVNTRIRFLFEGAGFPVVSFSDAGDPGEHIFNSVFAPVISVRVLGYRESDGLCSGTLNYSVNYTSLANWGGRELPALRTLERSESFRRSMLMTGATSLNGHVLSNATTYTEELIADIMAARRGDAYTSWLESID